MKRICSLLTVAFFIIPMMLLAGNKKSGKSEDRKFYYVMEKQTAIKNMQLKITVGEKQLFAVFTDSKTTQDFIRMMPLTLTMDDIYNREKYTSIPRELSKDGNVKKIYQTGDISYWLGGGIAIFYNQDGREVSAGLVQLAHITSGTEIFNVPGSVKVKFEVVEKL